MITPYKLPFYAKASLLLIGLYVFVSILWIAQDILIPLVFALILAILLHPVVNFFVHHKVNRILAIVISLSLTLLLIIVFAGLIISQASAFGNTWPLMVDKITVILNDSISGLSGYFDINHRLIPEWIARTKAELINNSGTTIGQTIMSLGSGILTMLLIPVYIFLILFYHPLLIDFIHRIFGSTHRAKVSEIVSQTKTVVQRYLVGLLIEVVLVGIMEIAALLILGIEYALLLGIVGAFLNMIPYIGGLVAVALPMIVALATKESGWYSIYVLAIYYFIQLIDNNYIVPYIVASKVQINALFSIIAVLAGNAIWGVSGMFLSIPLLAIVKLIFDHIDPLKPVGFLLGDSMPSLLKIQPIINKIKKIRR